MATIPIKMSLRTLNKIESQTIFSRVATWSRMNLYTSKKRTYMKRLKSGKFNEENF